MSEFLQYTQDKFTFRVATDRMYSAAGVWVRAANGRVTVGVSDFFQQHHGDVAFAEVIEVGTAVGIGDALAHIETIKADIELPSPLSGIVTAVNDALELEAEVINQSPYDRGWLAVVEAANWPADRTKLMTPQAYLDHMAAEARTEAGL